MRPTISPKRVITHEFPYEEQEGGVYTPKAKIDIQSVEPGIKTDQFNGIIDTGSQITIISIEIIKKFKFPVAGKEEALETARSGEKIYAVPYWGKIRVSNPNIKNNKYHFIKMYACKRKYLQQDILLGMNFINKYEIKFSGKLKKTFIEEEIFLG